VEPAGLGTDDLRDGGSESNDVVADFSLDVVYALQVEIRAFADALGSRLWDHACFRKRLGGGNFDREPGAEAVLITPDAAHFRSGRAWDHRAPHQKLGKLRDSRF